MLMKRLAVRGAVAFTIPVLIVFGLTLHANYYFLAAGPLCGIVGGLAYGRRWGLPILLGSCFGFTGILFALQETRSAWFTDVVWVGLVSGFLFWCIGAFALLVLPSDLRFRGAMAFAIPGAIAGMIFQFLYGPAHLLFDLGSRRWWGNFPWEHLVLWLIAGAGTGWLLGADLDNLHRPETASPMRIPNSWAVASVACAGIGLVSGLIYFLRYRLPFGLFNSLSPSSAASDWLFGWSVLAGVIAMIALMKKFGRGWATIGVVLALILLVASYRVDADPWKTRFNSNYAEKLLREHGHPGNPDYGNAIYTGNLILSQAALDRNDVATAKHYLLEAVATPGPRNIDQNGLDTSVARILLQRGERDTVLEYFKRGRNLWPQGAQLITRWEGIIRAGRIPNFNNRGQGQN
jgi:hypothetical protein